MSRRQRAASAQRVRGRPFQLREIQVAAGQMDAEAALRRRGDQRLHRLQRRRRPPRRRRCRRRHAAGSPAACPAAAPLPDSRSRPARRWRRAAGQRDADTSADGPPPAPAPTARDPPAGVRAGRPPRGAAVVRSPSTESTSTRPVCRTTASTMRARQGRRIGVGRPRRRLVLADPELGAESRGLVRPFPVQAEHVGGIARRQAAERSPSPRSTSRSTAFGGGIAAGADLRQRHRTVGQQPPRRAPGTGDRLAAPASRDRLRRAKRPAPGSRRSASSWPRKTSSMRGCWCAQQAERNQPPRSDHQAVVVAADLAVAAEAVGMDGHRLHHGPPARHSGAVAVQHRQAVAQQGDIRGRAAHVGDHAHRSSPARWRAPTTLAAGPDRMVSTGRVRANSADTSEPSPFTTISGARMPFSRIRPSTARISCCSWGISRAFRAVVRARRGASSFEVSSWPQVTGRPVRRRDQLPRRQLMGRIAHGKEAGDREGGDLGAVRARTAASSADTVQRRLLVAGGASGRRR